MNRFSVQVEWSPEDEGFIAVCPELGGVSAFGVTQLAALAELDVAMRLAIAAYEAHGWNVPEPKVRSVASGQFRVRLPKQLHAGLTSEAESEGVSLNTLIVSLLAQGIGHERGRTQAQDEMMVLVERFAKLMAAMEPIHMLQPPTGATTVGDPHMYSWEVQDPLLQSLGVRSY